MVRWELLEGGTILIKLQRNEVLYTISFLLALFFFFPIAKENNACCEKVN